MKILAIEGSATVASVAICEDDVVIAEYTLNYKKTHSQTLMPMIDDVMRMTETKPEDIELIAVAKGPGSFTGLRIVAATAKGFAMAIDKPIVGVPTIDAMAMGYMDSDKLICPMLDARRGNVYSGIYEFENRNQKVLMNTDLIIVEELLDKLNDIGREVIFVGDCLENVKELIKGKLNVDYTIAPELNNLPRASFVARLGKLYFEECKSIVAQDFLPDYFRESQAERELKNK